MTLPMQAPRRAQAVSTARAAELAARLCERMRARVIGREAAIESIAVALLADGHVLLEDVPGSGKTTLARSLGTAIRPDRVDAAQAPFRRIQFTADLLPSDVTGVSIFDARTGEFRFQRGPIFAHVVLADEINRASPKTQSALLEAMGERQVTVDEVTRELDAPFFVIATQNPLDHIGTYPLPLAQLDRFLLRVELGPIARDDELAVLDMPAAHAGATDDAPVATCSDVLDARAAIASGITVAPEIKAAMVDLAAAVRADPRVEAGCSTRSLVSLMPALQARALLRGRDWVAPEDLEALAVPALAHRIALVTGAGGAKALLSEALADPLERLARVGRRRWGRR